MSRKRSRSNAPLRTVFLPQELVAEILSFLEVKVIVRLRCLSKSWKALLSHSDFIEKHLKNSSQNPHLTLVWNQSKLPSKLYGMPHNVQLYPVHRLLKNPSINVYRNDFEPLEQCCEVVGLCNGLVCLLYCTWRPEPTKYWLRFWNPATRRRSKPLGFFSDSNPQYSGYKFTFGYDALTRTYKVVAEIVKITGQGSLITIVKVFNLCDSHWRNTQSFPGVPLNRLNHPYTRRYLNNEAVHLSGTINWLAMINSITHVVIVSLDLSTETYKQFLLPPGFDDVPFSEPDLRVLMGSLCFSHDSNKTEFVLWHMKEYGVQESWTQLFKISYQNILTDLLIDTSTIFKLACIYIIGDMAIFAIIIPKGCHNQAFIFNLKDNTLVKIKSENRIKWFVEAKDYVESLVSVPWEESATAKGEQYGRKIKGERKRKSI